MKVKNVMMQAIGLVFAGMMFFGCSGGGGVDSQTPDDLSIDAVGVENVTFVYNTAPRLNQTVGIQLEIYDSNDSNAKKVTATSTAVVDWYVAEQPNGSSLELTKVTDDGLRVEFIPQVSGTYVLTVKSQVDNSEVNTTFNITQQFPFEISDVEGYGAGVDEEQLIGAITGQYWIYAANQLNEEQLRDIASKFSSVTVLGYQRIRGLLVEIEGDASGVINEIIAEAGIRAVFERVYIGKGRITVDSVANPNDGSAFDDDGDNWHLEDIGMPEAWQFTTGDGSVVGIIDGDFFTGHEELEGKFFNVTHSNTDGMAAEDIVNFFTHGTATSGIICGDTGNGVGVSAIDWTCKLEAYPVDGIIDGDSNTWNMERLETAFAEAKVISNSWGIKHESQTLLSNKLEESWKMHLGFKVFIENDPSKLWVWSAGNDGLDALVGNGSIHEDIVTRKVAKKSNVVTVGAYYKDHILANYSNYGETVDIAAPTSFKAPKHFYNNTYFEDTKYGEQGENRDNDGYYAFNGTSAAAPIVTGVASLIFAIDPAFTPADVKHILIASSTENVERRYVDGNSNITEPLMHPIPILNAAAALEMASKIHEGKELYPQYSFTDPFSPAAHLIVKSKSSDYDLTGFTFRTGVEDTMLEVTGEETDYPITGGEAYQILGKAVMVHRKTGVVIEPNFDIDVSVPDVKVQVQDNNGNPLEQATIYIESMSSDPVFQSGNGLSDNLGVSRLYVKPANYKLIVEKEGYERLVKFVEITANIEVPQLIDCSLESVAVTPTASVSRVSPVTATVGKSTTFTVTGENFPSTIAMSLQDAECGASFNVTEISAQISCVPYAAGIKDFYVKKVSQGEFINSELPLKVDVQESATTSVDFENSCYDSPVNPFDQYADDWYECTRYAYGRSCETTGVKLTYTVVTDRHGGTWYDIVDPSYERGSEPTANSLAVWSDGNYGHVAFVESVDGDNVTISESNWAYPTDGKYNGQKTLTKTQMQARGSTAQYQLVGYVYLTKYPTISLTDVTPIYQSEEAHFEATVAESLDVKYSVKIRLGDGGGGYLEPQPMTPDASRTSFSYSRAISQAGERAYQVGLFEGDVQVGLWADGSYTVMETAQTGTITHNGVTYGTVTSPYTGKVWLDRNLGASQVCTTLDDTACYGDYYQWGRNIDGHEKSTSAASSTQATDINSVGHSNFIISSSSYSYDWAWNADSDGALRSVNWSKTDGTSVCPVGFRVPTIIELADETINSVDGVSYNLDVFNNFLKLPAAGFRYHADGLLYAQGEDVQIWSSNVSGSSSADLDLDGSDARIGYHSHAYGFSVRCIQDDTVTNQIPTAAAGADQTVTEGTAVTFDASGSSDSDGSIVSYEWKEGTTILSTLSSFTKSDFPVGTHTVTLTVTDNDGASSSGTVLVTVNAASSTTAVILKTGQTKSYDTAGTEVTDGSVKDDGYYQTGADRVYTRGGDIVTDHTTGLMWQDDTAAATVTKPWVTQANDDAGNYEDTSGDTAATYCADLELGGYTDWRLPTRKELVSLSDNGRVGPAIDPTFVNTASNFYWSSTTSADATDNAWLVYFYYGLQDYYSKAGSRYVRCVRAGQ